MPVLAPLRKRARTPLLPLILVVLAGTISFLIVGGFIAWLVVLEPGVREARFNQVRAGMTMSEVQRIMGVPREVHTRAALGSGIGEKCHPPGHASGYEPPHTFEWVSTRAHVVWWYRQATVIFDKNQRVLVKSGLIMFD